MASHRTHTFRQTIAIAGLTALLALLFVGTAVLIGGNSRLRADEYVGIEVVPVQADAPVMTTPTGPVKADPAWADRVAAHTDIGQIAALAYGTASLRLAAVHPGCKLGWSTLAGIGSIESGHGTHDGATLEPDGRTSHPILGPALDGSGHTAAIPSDSETVTWHGDPNWDHAVGPMQFIPSTWKKWGADASGDGVADPNNIADAAYTAGLYLCASGADLMTASGWTRAVFSYNHSDDYVRSVLSQANAYVAAVR